VSYNDKCGLCLCVCVCWCVCGHSGVYAYMCLYNCACFCVSCNLFRFQQFHRPTASNSDVYHDSLESLLQLYLAGYNVCLFVIGEPSSGKTYTIAGDGRTGGLIPLALHQLFTCLEGNLLGLGGGGDCSRTGGLIPLALHQLFTCLEGNSVGVRRGV